MELSFNGRNLLSKPEVACIIRKSKSWITQQISNAPSCKHIKRFGFPKPDSKLGHNIFWFEETINQWLEAQKTNYINNSVESD